jgi:hypothetical protein
MTATTRSPSDAPTRCATGSASFDAAERILERPPLPRSPPSPRAAGVARSTLHRRFPNGDALLAALQGAPQETSLETPDGALPAGRLGRERPVSLDAIQVFDVLPPAVLPEQLVAEAQRIAQVPVALYVLDIDGSHLLHMAGPRRLGDTPTASQISGSNSRPCPVHTCTPCGCADVPTEG